MQKNEPRLSAEMEKRFDEEFSASISSNNCMEDYTAEQVKHFLATALDEQSMRHAMLMSGLEAQIEQKAVIRASELVDEAKATALEEQRQSFIFAINTMELSGKSDDYRQAQDHILAILNGETL